MRIRPTIICNHHLTQTRYTTLYNTLAPGQGKRYFANDISGAFSWMETIVFRFRFQLNLPLRVQLEISHLWFRWWLGTELTVYATLATWKPQSQHQYVLLILSDNDTSYNLINQHIHHVDTSTGSMIFRKRISSSTIFKHMLSHFQ